MTQDSVITTIGKKVLLNRGYKSTPDYTPTSKFKVGINQTNDINVDTTVLDEAIPINNLITLDSCENANWNETGDAQGETVNSTVGQYIQGSGCLNLGKDKTTETNFGYNKILGETYTFSSGKKVYVWFYISDTDNLSETTAVKAGFGSDTTNYYYAIKDRSDLSDGWNHIIIDRDSALVEGVPTAASCDTLIIEMKTPNASDTITLGNCRMDYWFLTGSDSFEKDLDSVTVDENKLEVTMEGTLDTTDAIGFLIDSALTLNTDSSVKTTGADKFDGTSKGTSDVFKFIIKDRLV